MIVTIIAINRCGNMRTILHDLDNQCAGGFSGTAHNMFIKFVQTAEFGRFLFKKRKENERKAKKRKFQETSIT